MTWKFRNIHFQFDKISYLEITAIEQFYSYIFFATKIHKLSCLAADTLKYQIYIYLNISNFLIAIQIMYMCDKIVHRTQQYPWK